MVSDETVTATEQMFCRLVHVYQVNGMLDPIGLWAELFDAEGRLTLDQRGDGYMDLIARPEIQQEMHAQKRVLECIGVTTHQLLDELEAARQKAIAEPDGSSIALEATVIKARLLGLLPDKRVGEFVAGIFTDDEFRALPANQPVLLN